MKNETILINNLRLNNENNNQINMKPTGKILVIGSSNTDMTVKSPTIPRPGETVLGGEFKMGAGGKGANQAVAAKRLGGDVTFVCKVGNDIFGDNAIENYRKEGMDVSHVLRSEKPSGVALILVDAEAENCISVASGANADLTPADIEANEELIRTSSILLLQNEIPIESVLKAAKIAHEAGAYVILNPAPACALPDEIFRYVDLMTPNQTESEFYTGIPVNDEESAQKAADALRAKGVKDIIMTMGSKGSMGFTAEDTFFTPSRKVDAVDTTAAGDTFCGGLSVALSEGKTLREAAEFATKASALTVQKMGAQESIPYRNNL